MQTPTNQDTNAICSVTAMAVQVGLSRARFYELLKEGVFPQPHYSLRTRRPFYTSDLRRRCLEIRRTGIGLGGQPVVFSTLHKCTEPEGPHEVDYGELTRMLRGMKLRLTTSHVKTALAELYPKGVPKDVSEESLIRDLYLHFVRER